MLDNAVHKRLYYVHNEKPRRHYENIKETRITGQRLPKWVSIVPSPYSIKGGWIMYVLTIGSIVYLYDNDKDARKAYHHAVQKNGINNVKVTYND